MYDCIMGYDRLFQHFFINKISHYQKNYSKKSSLLIDL